MVSVFVEFFNRHLDEHGPLLPIVRAFSREDRSPRLAEIGVPTAVMVGTADSTTPPTHSRRLAAGIPGARLVQVPDAGHLLNREAPEDLIDVVESFAAQYGSEHSGRARPAPSPDDHFGVVPAVAAGRDHRRSVVEKGGVSADTGHLVGLAGDR